MPSHEAKVATRRNGVNDEQRGWERSPPSARLIKERIDEAVKQTVEFIDNNAAGLSFYDFERKLVPLVFTLGRLFVALFLRRCHETLIVPWREEIEGVVYERSREERRQVATFFGRVIFWRDYMSGEGGGFHPLDQTLRLLSDGFSLYLTSLMARLATKMSYGQAELVLTCFLGWSPSKETIERCVLGLGRHTQTWWLDAAPAPQGDGEVLITQFDNKATPTATEAELKKRRGKRKPNPYPDSPRHRGRDRRRARGPKKRRKKGDKSKNGRATTVVTMYTLRRATDSLGRPILKGPINKKVYASYGGRRHAFAMARRLADKRGFTTASGKLVQIVTDGDPVFADLVSEFFPGTIHSLDVIHAVEYLWKAGRSFHSEGTPELKAWVKEYEHLLYAGKAEKLVKKLKTLRRSIPKTGPGNKGKRKRLQETINYLGARTHMMNYDELRKQDLELASGAVEGAVRHVVAERFDNCGMRWTRERAEPLLQLRCIEINGDWEAFFDYIHEHCTSRIGRASDAKPLFSANPGPLPVLGVMHSEVKGQNCRKVPT
jgi:hypothetical protein